MGILINPLKLMEIGSENLNVIAAAESDGENSVAHAGLNQVLSQNMIYTFSQFELVVQDSSG